MLRKSPERTEALMAANRTNSQLSTGPRTDLGKQLSRGNALKHWGRAETIRPLLAALEEDPEEFERVRDALYQALAPRDAFEEIIVDDMADIHWRTSPRGVEGSQPRRRNAQHPAQSGHGGHLSRAHGEGVRREVEAAEGVSGKSGSRTATEGWQRAAGGWQSRACRVTSGVEQPRLAVRGWCRGLDLVGPAVFARLGQALALRSGPALQPPGASIQ